MQKEKRKRNSSSINSDFLTFPLTRHTKQPKKKKKVNINHIIQHSHLIILTEL